MKYLFILSLAFFTLGLPCAGSTQSMETEVIGSAGASFSTTAGTLEWTVGEPMIRTVVNGAILSEGFHQTAIWEIVPVHYAPELEFTVWPNPATDYLEIKTDRRVTVALFDLSGRKVTDDTTIETQAALPLEKLPPGAYFLEVSDLAQRRLATYKILHVNP